LATSKKPKKINRSTPTRTAPKKTTKKRIDPEALLNKVRLENQFNGGAGWFATIGIFSIINSLIFFFNGSLYFPVGLGATQLVDAISRLAAETQGTEAISVLATITIFVDLAIAGLFLLFSSLAKKRNKVAYLIGIILYGIDGILVLLFADFFGAAFHAFGLFSLIRGYRALTSLEEWETRYGAAPQAKKLAALQLAQDSPVSGTRIAKVVIPFTIGAAILGLICYGLMQFMY
jgi:hypothetical protein